MRVAVLVIGLLLGLVIFLQALIGYGAGSLADDEAIAGAGAVGVLVALLWLVGSAFAIGLPHVSMVVFVVAGILAFAISGDYGDMVVWGTLSIVLAVMSWLGRRGQLKGRREKAAEAQRQRDRDERLEALLRQQVS